MQANPFQLPDGSKQASAAPRAALYIRVSTEEQAMHGYSLEAQRESLTRYAREHRLSIVDYYVDEGRSARKRFRCRKEFMRMMDDVQQGKIDVILFIKLDRWFRSVSDYYKIQDILDAHGVHWKTTEEHYDTATTNGRLYINIRLSVAQDESDRDSDRIKYVFAAKAARGETLVGAQSLPLGLTVQGKRVVPDPAAAEIARAAFAHYELHQNKSAARRFLFQAYGVRITHQSLTRMLSNRLYIGEYRGNPAYCEPLIDTGRFLRVQAALANNARKTPSSRAYLFSGLAVCAECGRKMSGRYSRRGEREYYHYRCNQAANLHACPHSRVASEQELEALLLERVGAAADRCAVEFRVQAAVPPSGSGRARARRRLAKCKELYLSGLIPLEEYKAEYALLAPWLSEGPDAAAPETDTLSGLLGGGFRAVYAALDRDRRRAVWRSVIREIRIDAGNSASVFFNQSLYQ